MIACAQQMPKTSLRRLGPEWSLECASLHAASFACSWPELDFERLLAAPEVLGTGRIEPEGTKLVGFALSRAAADEAEILTIAVSPDRRRRGLGASLMAAHLPGLAELGVKHLFLEVNADNAAARALYARFGFRQVGMRKAYYRRESSSPADALVMRADLG